MKHAERSYLVIGLTVLLLGFAVILLHPDRPNTEAWITIAAVVGHWFGRNGSARSERADRDR